MRSQSPPSGRACPAQAAPSAGRSLLINISDWYKRAEAFMQQILAKTSSTSSEKEGRKKALRSKVALKTPVASPEAEDPDQ